LHTLFIDGKWTDSQDGLAPLAVINPATGEAFDQITSGGSRDIDRAVAAARAALDGPWGRMTATERGRVMQKMASIILERADTLTALEARDTGKPLAQARADIVSTARYFEFFGSAADKVHGQIIPYLSGYNVSVVREPYGVTGHILPWNYPAQMFGRTLAPALAMGNATVLKPSEDACLSSLALVEIAAEAGLPPGAINLVTGLGETAGAALTAHRDVNYLTFTGSPEVGAMVQRAAAENHVKCVLELGGKSPQIIFDDADLDLALPVIGRAITQNAGQTCSAGSRLMIQRGVYDAFIERVAERFSALRAGTPEMDLDCGPLINATQLKRVSGFIDRARAAGVPLLAQGTIAPGTPAAGYFVAPALFGPVDRQHELACDEVFGPVLSAIPFDDEADAIRLANATEYGLVAAIWSRDGSRQARVAKRMHCGQVFINCYGAGGGVELPFGGVKKSGHGREKGFLALEEVSVLKTIVQFHGE